MIRRSPTSRILVISVITVPWLLLWPLVRWSRSRSERADAVRIAARAYLEQFGVPAPSYQELSLELVAHLSVRWQPSRSSYIVGFGYQYVTPDARRDIVGDMVPFTSFTVVESFEVLPGGGCIYTGHKDGGPY